MESTAPKCAPPVTANAHLEALATDHLYHIGLSTNQPLGAMFGDVRVIVVGGSATRMRALAEGAVAALKLAVPFGLQPVNISDNPDRFSLFKAGPLLAVTHGIGGPSISIVLHELAKLCHYAGVPDAVFVRLGTSGGLGVVPGSVVVSDRVLNGALEPLCRATVLGRPIAHGTSLDPGVAALLQACADPAYTAEVASTMCCDDFYEGQARLDGAICDYTHDEKMAFLRQAHAVGVRNIEMESLYFAAFCMRLKLRGGVICVTLLDRLTGDQITSDHALLAEWNARGIALVHEFTRRVLRGDLQPRQH